MAGMTEKRKVRKDFDPKRAYSVDVSNCTEDEKKKVQQAFFDAGFLWKLKGKEYLHLGAEQYSNVYNDGTVAEYCLFGEVREFSITPKEFFELVYEPEQKGHPHAHLIALFAEDAKTTAEPWKLWQVKDKYMENVWFDLTGFPDWFEHLSFRRKPKTHVINGVEIPDLRFVPKEGEEYYVPHPIVAHLYLSTDYTASAHHCHRVSNNLCYEYTEEGKQAAIRHAKAVLGIC